MSTILSLKYLEIISKNAGLEHDLRDKEKYNIFVISNIVTDQLHEILEYKLRIENIPAQVRSGDYDNIVQDSLKYKDSNCIIIFWELSNLIDGLQFKIELFEQDQFDEFIEKTKKEIGLVLKNIQNSSLVLFNKFTALPFSNSNLGKNNLEILACELNKYLERNIPINGRLIDIEKVIAKTGLGKSLDLRYYNSSKSLYTVDLFKVYTDYITPLFLSAIGKAKKALVLDCDNTLWKGILGEDGFDKIEMSSSTKDGSIFCEIQSIALTLSKRGILLCLCSKNNHEDVDEVIKLHPHMQLRDEHITINKSNWLDKVSNINDISRELNISLDSLVVIDDSPFEVNFIKTQLPEITILQVPERLYDYPKMLRENLGLFYNYSFTAEDQKKIKMYKQHLKSETDKKEFADIESYLNSLELKMTIHNDDETIIPRMSQMSQKTNQFNLTTKRYTVSEIKNYVTSKNSKVIAFSISDKYGDSGVTGLCIINLDYKNKTAEIDTFLLSCRILGRNIEYAFFDYIMNAMNIDNFNTIFAKYIKTRKNEQVKNFYDACGFNCIEKKETEKTYNLDFENHTRRNIKYVDIAYG